MRKRWKRRRRRRGEERRGELEWKDPTSQIAPITGTFRSQVLQKTLAAVPPNLFPSFSLACCVFCSLFLLPLIFLFFYFILQSQWGYCWWGTSCSNFPSVFFLSHNNQGAMKQHSSDFFCSLLVEQKVMIEVLLLFFATRLKKVHSLSLSLWIYV